MGAPGPLDQLIGRINDTVGGPASATWTLSLARMSMGVLWLASLRWKLPPDFGAEGHRSLREWLDLETEHALIGLYRDLIADLVIPNFTLFAWLVFLAELIVGLCLLFGLFTRPAALVGLLMAINLAIGAGAIPGEWIWSYAMMVMMHGIILFSAAGSFWSADGFRRSADQQPQARGMT